MKKIDSDASLSFDSPVGRISLYARGNKVVFIEMGSIGKKTGGAPTVGKSAVLVDAQKQITDYFAGKTKVLNFPVAYSGTEFQEAVWKVIDKIKFGRTLTYGEIAEKIGNPAAVRAVGGAVGANPLALRIGCHRVLGSTGTITGYSGGDGVPTKKLLLALEQIEYK